MNKTEQINNNLYYNNINSQNEQNLKIVNYENLEENELKLKEKYNMLIPAFLVEFKDSNFSAENDSAEVKTFFESLFASYKNA